MAALRLTKAEGGGVDYDDELPPVRPPASFHTSLANTNTLIRLLGALSRHDLTCSFDFTYVCYEPFARDIYYASNHENIASTATRGGKALLRPWDRHQRLWSVPRRRYHASRWSPSLAVLDSDILHSRERDISRGYSINLACIGLPSAPGLPTVITWCLAPAHLPSRATTPQPSFLL